jgi:hypothetical protein
MKTVLVTFLPAFWLIAGGQSLVAAPDSPDIVRSGSTGACKSASYCRIHALLCSKLLNRASSGRLGKSAFRDNPVPLESLPEFPARSVLNLSETRKSPPTISARWQFDTRAACHPRAPCSAS